jgi:hydroxymethylpyrimidine pyrophosphatase-like HAD family hydrolase
MLPTKEAKKLKNAKAVTELASSLSLGYYPAEAVELTSTEVTKLDGLKKVRELFQHTSTPILALGDSPSDLAVFEFLVEHRAGIIATPDTAKDLMIEFVTNHRGIVYPKGQAEDVLHTVFAFNHLRALKDSGVIGEGA